jgi:hypothetical protein
MVSLLQWNDRLLLVELAYRVVLLAPAHLIILDEQYIEAYAPRLAAGASSVRCMPEAMDLSFYHPLLIVGIINNPVVGELTIDESSLLPVSHEVASLILVVTGPLINRSSWCCEPTLRCSGQTKAHHVPYVP